MRYSIDGAMTEIMARGGRLARKRERQRIRHLGGATALLALLLVTVLSTLNGPSDQTASGYGAFLLSPHAGGYILAGVLCFALGVAFALLCIHLRGRSGQNNGKEENQPNRQEEER